MEEYILITPINSYLKSQITLATSFIIFMIQAPDEVKPIRPTDLL